MGLKEGLLGTWQSPTLESGQQSRHPTTDHTEEEAQPWITWREPPPGSHRKPPPWITGGRITPGPRMHGESPTDHMESPMDHMEKAPHPDRTERSPRIPRRGSPHPDHMENPHLNHMDPPPRDHMKTPPGSHGPHGYMERAPTPDHMEKTPHPGSHRAPTPDHTERPHTDHTERRRPQRSCCCGACWGAPMRVLLSSEDRVVGAECEGQHGPRRGSM